MTLNMQSAPTNYLSHVKFIIKMYERDGVELPHAFQKDAIQNAAGARSNPSKWHGWKCIIKLFENDKGRFLIVEDFGTTGLTGPNLTIDQISEMCANDEDFPENYRLARLSCRNVSGDLKAGAGLFGVGKTLYSAASNAKVCKYYFESIIDTGEYRANINDRNMLRSEGAFTNEEGKRFIKEETGLEPIDHVGTRFIIVDPKDEIVEAITSGRMERDAAETWWRIIPFLNEDEGIFINDKRVEIPEQYSESNIYAGQGRQSDKHNDLVDGLCTKKYGLFICKELDPQLRGFYFYRRGMKIGKIEMQDVPKDIEDKYYGFIELQSDYEEELANIESGTHYDVDGTKKNSKIYSAMRDFVREFFKECLISWGYIKVKENENKRLYQMAKEIQNQVQNLFKQNGFEEIGKGDIKKQYHAGFQNVVYPNPDEERTVHTNDKIKFQFYIRNHTIIENQFNVRIVIKSSTKTNEIYSKKITVDGSDKYVSEELAIEVNELNAERYSDNDVVLSVEPSIGRRNENKHIYFYYDIETKKNPERDFELIMSNRNMPRQNDKRINTGEVISDIHYSLTNNTNTTTKLLFTVNTLNCESGNSLIEKVLREEYTVEPCSEIETNPFDIVFSQELYEDKLSKGKIQIRARAIVAENSGIYAKGDIVGEFNYFIFFNKNQKSGVEDSFEPSIVRDPNDKRCSWIEGKQGSRKIIINAGHPEFDLLPDENSREMYIARLMIKEFAYLYLREGKFSVILEDDPDGSKTNSVDLIEILNRKIDELWWARCQN